MSKVFRSALWTARSPAEVACQPSKRTKRTTSSISPTMRSTMMGVFSFFTCLISPLVLLWLCPHRFLLARLSHSERHLGRIEGLLRNSKLLTGFVSVSQVFQALSGAFDLGLLRYFRRRRIILTSTSRAFWSGFGVPSMEPRPPHQEQVASMLSSTLRTWTLSWMFNGLRTQDMPNQSTITLGAERIHRPVSHR